MKSTVLLFLCLCISSAFCAPQGGLLDQLINKVFKNDCLERTLSNNTCGILFGDDGCDGWQKEIDTNTTNKDMGFIRGNSAESVIVKKNCIMLAYEESGSTVGERGKRVVFDARGLEQNYLWRDLTDATLEEDIESVDCYCGDEIPDEFSGSLQRSRSGAVDPKSNMSKRKIKKCPPVPDHVCAILFDDDDCDKGDWDAPLIINSGESKSFSILSDYRNDIESFIVREGCVLEAFDDSDYDDDSLRASAINGDLYVNLDDHPNEDYDDLEEDIESIRCNCNF